MPTVTDLIRRHCLARVPDPMPDLDSLRRSERCPEFERLRSNRKILGAFRYGMMGASGKPRYDRIACMIRRLDEYRRDANAEHLLDVANLCELEFVEGNHRGVIARDDTPHTKEES